MNIRKYNRKLKYSHLHNKKQRKLKLNIITNYIRQFNINYSTFINKLFNNNIKINRKIILNIAMSENSTMNSLIKILN